MSLVAGGQPRLIVATVRDDGAFGWGGVFNGGAWLQVDGRKVDVHYRDLDDVEHQLAEARAGRFGIERLLFYLAGVPTYVVVAEIALNQVLYGLAAAVAGLSPGPPAGARRARARCTSDH